jgi:hypothetical protein
LLKTNQELLKDRLITPYYEFPRIFLNGYQYKENKTIMTISDCWNLCEINILIKCDAISYNHYENACFFFDDEFYQKSSLGEDNRFTTLMRKSKFF